MGSDSERISKEQAHAYWKNPRDDNNLPERYIDLDSKDSRVVRSEALVELFSRYVKNDASILELGCNAGRNLDFLRRSNFTKLSAIEISQNAIDTMREHLPDVHKSVDITVGSAEDILPSIPDRQYDVIFSMAVLVHIHYDSSWIIAEMARCSRRRIITIELERNTESTRHFPRLYRPIIESLGFAQSRAIRRFPGLPSGYIGRVFTRQKDS